MKTYIGTKIISAMPMTRWEYNAYRGWETPADEKNFDVAGYLVEYTYGSKGNDSRHAGYISWSPKHVFDAAYLEIGDVSGMPAHQQRVVAERAQLNDKCNKLEKFIETSPVFDALPAEERDDLIAQHDAMCQYSNLLTSRIARFGSAA